MAKKDLLKQQAAMDADLKVGKQVKKKSPIKKPVAKPIPVKGDAVDRLTSYMETDVNTNPNYSPTNINVKTSGATPAPSAPSAPKVTGIIPTTSNSITQPIQSAPAPIQSAPAPVQTTPTPAPAPPQKTTQQMIEEMNAQRLQSQLASLQAAHERAMAELESNYSTRQNTLGTTKNTYLTNLENALRSSMGSIDSEAAKVQPFYYDKRNEAAAASDVGAMNFAQYMASRGVKGAAAGMPTIYQNAALQGRVGALDQAEAQDMAEIERNRSLLQSEYDTNIANVLNNYAADIKALEDAYLTNRTGLTSAYEQDRLAAESGVSAEGLQAAIDQMNADRQFGLQEGQLMGMYDGKPTLQMQQFQFDSEFREKQFAADQSYRNRQLSIDAAYKNGQLSLQQAQQAMAQAKFDYQKEQDALNRQYQAEKDALDRQYRQEQFAYQKQQDLLDRQRQTTLDNYNMQPQQQDLSKYTQTAIGLRYSGASSAEIMAYINSLPISNSEKDRMAKSLGY